MMKNSPVTHKNQDTVHELKILETINGTVQHNRIY